MNKTKGNIIIIVGLVVVVALAIGGYLMTKEQKTISNGDQINSNQEIKQKTKKVSTGDEKKVIKSKKKGFSLV